MSSTPVTAPPAEAPETKSEKFTRLAMARTNEAIHRLRKIRGLASPNYEWNPDQVTKIVAALKDEIVGIEKSFEGKTKKKEEVSFSL
jgi:hypothetical protein